MERYPKVLFVAQRCVFTAFLGAFCCPWLHIFSQTSQNSEKGVVHREAGREKACELGSDGSEAPGGSFRSSGKPDTKLVM